MKKTLLLLLIIPFIVACDNEEPEVDMIDNIEQGIVGGWRCEKPLSSHIAIIVYEFSIDKTFSDVRWLTQGQSSSEKNISGGEYAIEDRDLKLTYTQKEGKISYFKITKLTDKELILNSETDSYIFQRIK